MRISSSPRLNSLALSVVEVSLLLGVALGATVGCAKKDSTPDAKFYTESANLQNADKVSIEVGSQVVLRSTKDFANETEYNRILGVLSRHKDLVLAHQNEIDRIVVGAGGTGMSLSRDKYEVSISLYASESDIVHLFSDRFTETANAEKKNSEFSRAITLGVNDTVGLFGSDVTSASNKLRQLSRGVNFTQDSGFRQLVLGSSGFAVLPNGMVIDITRDADRIISEVKMGIDARLTWSMMVSPLAQQLGLDISYQPGVFDGAELQKVIEKIRGSGSLIASVNHTFTRVIFGKRFDSDLAAGTVLLDYRASDADITAAIRRFDTPIVTVDLEPIRGEIQSAFAARGYKFDRVDVDVPATSENLRALRTFRFNVVPYMQLDALRKMHAQVLHIGNEQIQFITQINALYLPVTSSIATVDAFTAEYPVKADFTAVDTIFQNYAYGLNLTYSSITYGRSQAQVERYRNFVQWFTREVNSTFITTNRILNLRVTDDGSPAVFNGGMLVIDLQTFDPAQIRIVLSKPQRGN